MSIHQEALERSRASQGTLAQHQMPHRRPEEEDEYAADDFGGGDDDDDDDDFGFSDFIAADENGQRYSSISFQDEAFVDDGAPPESKTNTTALLDAICSGNALGGSNDYEFFNTATVEKMTSGNVWAGSAHWKKTEKQSNKKKRAAAAPKKKKKQSKKKKVAKPSGVIDFSKTPCLDDVLRTAPKNKRGTDPLQLSKANKTKYGKADNLLPPDAGIGIEQLSTLFLRPNTVLGKVDEENRGKTKTVGKLKDERYYLGSFVTCSHFTTTTTHYRVPRQCRILWGWDLITAGMTIPLEETTMVLVLRLPIPVTTTLSLESSRE